MALAMTRDSQRMVPWPIFVLHVRSQGSIFQMTGRIFLTSNSISQSDQSANPNLANLLDGSFDVPLLLMATFMRIT
jgi:hypothetical protein